MPCCFPLLPFIYMLTVLMSSSCCPMIHLNHVCLDRWRYLNLYFSYRYYSWSLSFSILVALNIFMGWFRETKKQPSLIFIIEEYFFAVNCFLKANKMLSFHSLLAFPADVESQLSLSLLLLWRLSAFSFSYFKEYFL